MNDQPLPARLRARIALGVLAVLLAPIFTRAADDDAWAPIPRRLPPAGIDIGDAARGDIAAALAVLNVRLAALPAKQRLGPPIADVLIYEKAVRLALSHGEFWKPEQAKIALAALKTANERLDALKEGKQPWAQGRGAFVLGYRSYIDDSVQPYGVEVPEGLDLSKPARLYIWLHGRGEQETDLYFINNRTGKPGQIKPTDGIVLHPFGRQCIGFKSVGETDVNEAMHAAMKRFKIDRDRIALMGFSMGGAGAWHIGAHRTEEYAAIHAGAGFVDVVKFLRMKESSYPPAVSQTLWGLYDVPEPLQRPGHHLRRRSRPAACGW